MGTPDLVAKGQPSKADHINWYNIGNRHGQTLLMFFGLIASYALRTNLSVAIVAMTSQGENNNFKVLHWNSQQKGLILSSFFWGYMILQVPGGLLAKAYGPKVVLVVTCLITSVLTILTPIVAINGGWIATICMRVLIGLAQSSVYPCVNTHMARWAVPGERSKLFAFAFSGSEIGAMIILWIGGSLAANSTFGWPSIFYFSGAAGLVWSLFCYIYAADSPSEHKSISEVEKEFINEALVFNKTIIKDLKTPWKEIFLSIPFWGLALAHMGNCWGFIVLLTLIPSYIDGVLHFNLGNNGFLSALPYLAQWIASIIFSVIADLLNYYKVTSTSLSRKLWNSVGHYGGAAALLALAYTTDTNVTTAIVLLVLSVALNAATFMGYLCNHIDLSPNFAGPLMGLTNGMSNIPAILGPIVSGFILTDMSNRDEWKTVFIIAAAIFIVGNTAFLIFGSGKVQHWNEPKKNSKTDI